MVASKKLARRVADNVIDDVVEAGWPTGEILGSEPDLLKRYGVSRAVFREAVRLLEHRGVARARRGPGGGLMVSEPSELPVLDAVSIYAHFIDVPLSELFEVRRIVEPLAASLAAQNLTEPDIAELRHLAVEPGVDHQALHRHLATLSGNPAIELFASILVRLTDLYIGSLRLPPRQAEADRAANAHEHEQIVDAAISGDAGRAAHLMAEHLTVVEEFLSEHRAARSPLDHVLARGGPTNGARAESVAREIFVDVATRGWPTGEVLGSEPVLLERLGVSRSVLREAVRLLEHHQVAEMRQGPGGGLVVAAPGADAIAEAMSIILEYRGIESAQLLEARIALEIAAAGLAAKSPDPAVDSLDAILAEEAADPVAALDPAGQHVHMAAAEMSGNRLLVLFLRMLIRLSVRRNPSEARPGVDVGALADRVHLDHIEIAEAIRAGDAPLAMHRMREHFLKLAPNFTE